VPPPARNGEHGYGWASKALHWLTVAAVATQFCVGWLMDADDDSGRGRGRGRGRSGESGRGRGRGGEDGAGYLDDPSLLVTVHVVLGLSILVLVALRITWRRVAGLPPWSPALSARQRRLAHVTERALLGVLLVVPATGLVLVAVGDDVLWLHVAAHVLFLVALVAHLTTNLRPVVLRRML